MTDLHEVPPVEQIREAVAGQLLDLAEQPGILQRDGASLTAAVSNDGRGPGRPWASPDGHLLVVHSRHPVGQRGNCP